MAPADRFTPGAAPYVRAEALRRISRLWWLPALALIVLVACGFSDTRFFFLALMLLFIVYPMVLSMMWITLAGNKALVLFSRPQEWTFSDEAFEVRFFPYDADADTPPLSTLRVPYSEVTAVEDKGKHLLICAHSLPCSFPFLLTPAGTVPAKTYDLLCRI